MVASERAMLETPAHIGTVSLSHHEPGQCLDGRTACELRVQLAWVRILMLFTDKLAVSIRDPNWWLHSLGVRLRQKISKGYNTHLYLAKGMNIGM